MGQTQLGVNWLCPKHFKGARLALRLHHQHIWPKEDFFLAVGASSHARAQLTLARARCSVESSPRLAPQLSTILGESIGQAGKHASARVGLTSLLAYGRLCISFMEINTLIIQKSE